MCPEYLLLIRTKSDNTAFVYWRCYIYNIQFGGTSAYGIEVHKREYWQILHVVLTCNLQTLTTLVGSFLKAHLYAGGQHLLCLCVIPGTQWAKSLCTLPPAQYSQMAVYLLPKVLASYLSFQSIWSLPNSPESAAGYLHFQLSCPVWPPSSQTKQLPGKGLLPHFSVFSAAHHPGRSRCPTHSCHLIDGYRGVTIRAGFHHENRQQEMGGRRTGSKGYWGPQGKHH